MIHCLHDNVWESNNFDFVTEGGASVVFGHKHCRCCVLKLRKINCADGVSLHDIHEQILNSNMSDLEFIAANFISQEYLSDFIPRAVVVSTVTDCLLLHLDILWKDSRSVNRQREDSGKVTLSSTGIFEENVFHHSQIAAINDFQAINFSIEIKVKSCFSSISPFIHNKDSLIKHIKTRYEIMQLYKEQRRQKYRDSDAPWGVFHEISQYRPSDLCSGKFSLVYNALKSLFINPQNNLKVYHEDQHIYGWSIDSYHLLNSFMERVFHDVESEETSLSSLSFMIAEKLISSYSNTFHRLAEFQQLDIIDSEGAQLVYIHLQTFFVDKRDCDQDLLLYLKGAPTESFEKFTSFVKLLHSDIEADSFNAALQAANGILSVGIISLFHLVYEFRSCLSIPTFSVEQKQCFYLRAHGLLSSKLNKMDCLLLLKAWMISTIACDASVVMKFCVNDKQIISSRLSVIDLGIKSFTKLTTKADKDAKICKIIQGIC